MTSSSAPAPGRFLARQLWLVALVALLSVSAALQAAAQTQPGSFADLADEVSPAVVNITTSTTVAERIGPMPDIPEGSPFEDFFRDFMDRNGEPQTPRRSQALGSGFVISEDGFIVTNNHVIENADEITVEFFTGFELVAEVVGTDPNTDIALLKVEASGPLPFVPFGDSDAMRVGDWVIAVGNPLGQGFSVSAGIVSARGRALAGAYDDYLQTDAAINRGNSGGPLFNMEGDVIGVNTAILSPTGGSIGIGFAMASNVVTTVIEQLQTYGETRRGWLGVRIQDVTDDIAESIGLDTARGALVTDVPEGPAMEAGILSGDVILSFDGREIADTRELVSMVGNSAVGATVDMEVWRDGEIQTLAVTLGRREEAEGFADLMPEGEPAEGVVLGMTLSEMTDVLRQELGLSNGATGLVVIEVEPESEAYAKDLRAGDIIAEAGQAQVNTLAELEDRIATARDAGRRSILLLVRREGEPRFVALPITEEE